MLMNGYSDNTSFYTDDPGTEVLRDVSMRHADGFTSLSEMYRSAGGGTRLLTGIRYGRLHILKTLLPETQSDPVKRVMLRKEFEVGITLDHSNIRRTLGFEEVAGIGEAIVMEYVDGVPLDEAVNRGMVTRENVRSIVRQIASAMEYLHSRQIIHRDLKPANVLLTFTGNVVKVIDFSMADGGEFTVLKNPGGTRGYIAPEQTAGGAVATVEADIYSLGKIMEGLAKGHRRP